MSIPDDADENIGDNLREADEQLEGDDVDTDSSSREDPPSRQ